MTFTETLTICVTTRPINACMFGYGEDETGSIGAVDAASNERLPEEYKLGAHPESFQLQSSGINIYVNLLDLKQIAVINRKTHAIIRWADDPGAQFPDGP